MIARCLDFDYSQVTRHEGLEKYFTTQHFECFANNFKPNEGYLVVAIASGPSCFWLFLADRFFGFKYPLHCPSVFLETMQSSFSRYWERGVWTTNRGEKSTLFAPKCWVDDDCFHGRLFEGNADAYRKYDEAYSKLYTEFPLPWIQKKAIALDEGNWVSDPDYDYQWEVDPAFAMTIEPETGETYHNPLYDFENSLHR